MTDELEPKEPVVLDAEGNVLHDPSRVSRSHRKAEFKVVQLGQIGLVPKILLGTTFIVLLLLGLTVAGIALGVFVMTLIARALFTQKRR